MVIRNNMTATTRFNETDIALKKVQIDAKYQITLEANKNAVMVKKLKDNIELFFTDNEKRVKEKLYKELDLKLGEAMIRCHDNITCDSLRIMQENEASLREYLAKSIKDCGALISIPGLIKGSDVYPGEC
jgi:hypothetical protein